MSRKILISLALGALALFTVRARADDGDTPPRAGRPAHLIQRFDANGDGRVDEAEREQARDALRDRRRDGAGARDGRTERRRPMDRSGRAERCETCGRREPGARGQLRQNLRDRADRAARGRSERRFVRRGAWPRRRLEVRRRLRDRLARRGMRRDRLERERLLRHRR